MRNIIKFCFPNIRKYLLMNNFISINIPRHYSLSDAIIDFSFKFSI
jgi:hypothetical protein